MTTQEKAGKDTVKEERLLEKRRRKDRVKCPKDDVTSADHVRVCPVKQESKGKENDGGL